MGTRLSKAYLLTKVLTASNQEVVVYLYEGAIGYLHRATEAMREGNRGEAGKLIDRVISILIELSGNLNYNSGGHLALRLDGIYNYLIETLSLANGREDTEALDACEGILVILHDAWRQAVQMQSDTKPDDHSKQFQVSA